MNNDMVRYNSTIHVHLVNDKDIQKLNKKHRGKDYPTDVLSFHMDEEMPDGTYYIGDILVNIDQAKRQMKDYDNDDVRQEIAELVEHGVLHLLGIHHEHDD
jgi:probable rRNA maturation factor